MRQAIEPLVKRSDRYLVRVQLVWELFRIRPELEKGAVTNKSDEATGHARAIPKSPPLLLRVPGPPSLWWAGGSSLVSGC